MSSLEEDIEDCIRDINNAEVIGEPGRIICPVCLEPCEVQRCKVVCTSAHCVHRVVMNCSEY